MIAGRYLQIRAMLVNRQISTAGNLWNDEEFKYCKMNDIYLEIIASMEDKEMNRKVSRIFCAWEESWKKRKLGP